MIITIEGILYLVIITKDLEVMKCNFQLKFHQGSTQIQHIEAEVNGTRQLYKNRLAT